MNRVNISLLEGKYNKEIRTKLYKLIFMPGGILRMGLCGMIALKLKKELFPEMF